jgi:hypothetical protein
MSQEYTQGKRKILAQSLNWATDDIRAVPVGSAFSHVASHEFVSQVAGVLGAAGERIATTGRSVTVNGTLVELRIDDPVFAALDVGEVHGILLYRHTGADSANDLVCFITGPGFPRASNGGSFTVDLPGWVLRA